MRAKDLASLSRADNEIAAARCLGVAVGIAFVAAACFLSGRI